MHLAGRGALTLYPDLDRPDDELCKSEGDMMPGALAYARGDLVLPVDDPPGAGYAMKMIEAWRADKAAMDEGDIRGDINVGCGPVDSGNMAQLTEGLTPETPDSGEDAPVDSLESAKTPEMACEALEGE